jgi:hypothetical protein
MQGIREPAQSRECHTAYCLQKPESETSGEASSVLTSEDEHREISFPPVQDLEHKGARVQCEIDGICTSTTGWFGNQLRQS